MDLSGWDAAQKALCGLTVLAAIPVVLFAIWADYYAQYMAKARKNSPNFDPKVERERIRIAQFCVGLFETLLFLGSMELAQEHPRTCTAIFFIALLSIGIIRIALERPLDPPLLSPGNKSESRASASGSKALLFGLASGFLYVMTVMSFVKVCAWIAQGLHFSSVAAGTLVMLGAAVGIFSGLALNFALAPWQMRHSLPVVAMTEDELEFAKPVLEQAGIQNIQCWIVEEQQAMAAIAGFSWGGGVFKPALFISRKVKNTLTELELQAVIAHEASHVLAKHLRKRVLLSAALIISLTFIAIFATLATYKFAPTGPFQGSAGMFIGCAAFFCAYFILQKQSRVHEFQADWLAVHKLGADFDAWSNSLRKMDQLNGFPLLPGMLSSHPRTEIRIANVAKMIEFMAVLKKTEAQQPSREKPAA
jgi:Zn-dependent protease with chaperone function